MKRSWLMAPLLALTIAGLALAQSRTALIYTSVPQNVMDAIQAAYHRDNPGWRLEVFRGGTSAIIARLAAERQAGGIQGDLIWVADPTEIEVFKGEGLLLTHTSAETRALPAAFRDPGNQYFAGRILGIVIAYNTLTVRGDDVPTSWRDLLKPTFRGAIGWPTPVNSGAAVVTIGAVLDWPQFGETLIRQLGAHGMRRLQNNGQAATMTASGELKAALGLDFQIRALKAEGSPIDYVYPVDGTVLIPSPLAIFNTSRNVEAAKHFLDYVISRSGQEVMVSEANFLPVRPDVTGPPGGPPPNVTMLPIDYDFIGRSKDRILQVYDTNIRTE